MNIFKKLRKYVQLLYQLNSRLYKIERAVGRIELRQSQQNSSKDINAHEFQVFSQWGEDGIIQYLIRNVPIENKIFVEFGVENYTESNTRFLLENNNWSGLVIDSSEENIRYIKNDPTVYWKYNLKAVCAFIDRDNINDLLIENGISGDMGLLSIDIDGNDYWVWESINCISPRIVICEYNHIFGATAKVTVPYNPHFTKDHFFGLYYGASIAALEKLSKEKGYALVGSNSNGLNAFFVRNDVIGDLPIKTSAEAYVQAQLRESKDNKGNLTFLDFNQRRAQIAKMEVYDIDLERNVPVEKKA